MMIYLKKNALVKKTFSQDVKSGVHVAFNSNNYPTDEENNPQVN